MRHSERISIKINGRSDRTSMLLFTCFPCYKRKLLTIIYTLGLSCGVPRLVYDYLAHCKDTTRYFWQISIDNLLFITIIKSLCASFGGRAREIHCESTQEKLGAQVKVNSICKINFDARKFKSGAIIVRKRETNAL